MGIVTDGNAAPIRGANITVKGREEFVIKTTPAGEYWRLLLPGTYTLQVSAVNTRDMHTLSQFLMMLLLGSDIL